jgi:PAS domain S-box-containing protein
MAHGYCVLWDSWTVTTHVSADILIALSYLAITLTLFSVTRAAKDYEFNWLIILGGAFILSCGFSHLVGSFAFFYSLYTVEGLAKVNTAAWSVLSAGLLFLYRKELTGISLPKRLEAVTTRAEDIARRQDLLRELTTALITKENELQETTEEVKSFRQLVNGIPLLVWMADETGNIFWYNDNWYAYTGTTPEQMLGWGWQSVHDPATLPEVIERWKTCLATGQCFEMEFPLKGADGRFRRFLTRVNPLRDADGRITRWFGSNTDVDATTAETAEVISSAVSAVVRDTTTTTTRTGGGRERTLPHGTQ